MISKERVVGIQTLNILIFAASFLFFISSVYIGSKMDKKTVEIEQQINRSKAVQKELMKEVNGLMYDLRVCRKTRYEPRPLRPLTCE